MATKLEMLQAAATEINGIKIDGDAMFNNQIDPALTTIPAMKKAILAEVDGELYVSDEERFTPETWKVLTDIVKVKVLADPDAAEEEPEPAPKKAAAKPAAKKAAPAKKDPVEKAPAATKSKAAPKKATAKKTAATKTPAKSKAKSSGPSNKLQLYTNWKKMKKTAAKMTDADFEKLHKSVPGSNLTSIKTWVKYRWAKGNDLPTGA